MPSVIGFSTLLSVAGSGFRVTKSIPSAWMTQWTSWRWWKAEKPASASPCRWPTTEPWFTWAACGEIIPSLRPIICKGSGWPVLLFFQTPRSLRRQSGPSRALTDRGTPFPAAVSTPRSTLKCAKKPVQLLSECVSPKSWQEMKCIVRRARSKVVRKSCQVTGAKVSWCSEQSAALGCSDLVHPPSPLPPPRRRGF